MLSCSATYHLITKGGQYDLFSISRNKVSGQRRGYFSDGRDLDFDFFRKQVEHFKPRKPEECHFPKIEQFLAEMENTELYYSDSSSKFSLKHKLPLE